MDLTLKFMVPVYVVIDTETNEIHKVVVEDDAPMKMPEEVYTPDGLDADNDEVALALTAYRRNDEQGLDWPAWGFGW